VEDERFCSFPETTSCTSKSDEDESELSSLSGLEMVSQDVWERCSKHARETANHLVATKFTNCELY